MPSNYRQSSYDVFLNSISTLDAKNLEAGVGVLRAVQALHVLGVFLYQTSLASGRRHLLREKRQRVCCEVKTITKQGAGRRGFSLENSVFEKLAETLPKARKQLEATAKKLQCQVKILVYVMNWLEHSIVLDQDSYQKIVNKLESGGPDALPGDTEMPLRGSASKITDFVPYVLRHTALTRLGEAAGGDVFVLARIAGHSSITITQRYIHPQADAISRVFSQVGTKLGTVAIAAREKPEQLEAASRKQPA
jgi:hypothetical protein